MYSTLLFLHSLFRWLVVISLLLAIYRAYRGFVKGAAFLQADNLVRHWTATIAHVQLIVGMLLYLKSPIVAFFWKNQSMTADYSFFSLVHMLLMLTAIVLVTIGSAKAKRQQGDKEKFKVMLLWYSIAFIIILLAIPWPFSPFANRPIFRPI